MPPLVSVLLATHDHAATLPEAIDSILGQTLTDLELIALDDGSRDETPRILAGYATRDNRVRVLRNEQRRGLPAALNRGLTAARGGLIARMDADDRSHPDRLAHQVAAMAAHPEVGVLGAQPRFIDESGAALSGWQWRAPLTHDEIAWSLLDGNPMVHPSVMARAELLRHAGGYNETFPRGQDMELWTRLIAVTRFANLDDALIDYRVEPRAFRAKLAAMAPLIQRIAHGYAERVLARPVPIELIAAIYRINRDQQPPTLPADQGIDAGLLLADLFAAMIDAGVLTEQACAGARALMRGQVQRLVAGAAV